MTNTLDYHCAKSNHDQCRLTRSEISTLCEEFALVTNTDADFAIMMLEENQWNLEHAINAYLNKPKSSVEKIDHEDPASEGSSMKKQFKLLSWNIDGLDEQALDIRTYGVIETIKREEPHAVFLQEVIPSTLELIRTGLPEYQSYAGNIEGYFLVILTLRAVLRVHGFEIIVYPGTVMNRNLLIVHTTYKNSMEIDLMTSHHESGTQEGISNQRIEQLKLSFQRMIDAPSDRLVLFGGDLNMRERELQKIGGTPPGICDLWIETGKRKECTYTWDMQINTNNYFSSDTFRPRARFDRLYFRPSNNSKIKFQPIHFELQGLEKLSSMQRFCSDHWAIQVSFNI